MDARSAVAAAAAAPGLLVWLAAGFLLSTAAAQSCSTDSPFVGFEGALTEMEHDVSGRLHILDDCTAEVKGFTYDGNAPAAYWWGAPSTSNSAIRRDGRRIAKMRVDRAYDGETITFTLEEGLSWEDFPVISLWCEDFTADFGHVEIKSVKPLQFPPAEKAPSPSPPAAKAPSPSPPAEEAPAAQEAPPPAPEAKPSEGGLGLANCLELKPGYFNLHWEGRIGDNPNRWLGFGVSEPNATDVLMPGSDVVVVGMVNGECFALDYQLERRSQCSYPDGEGVCPDTALSGDPATDQVELVSCEKVGDVLAVVVTRPLSASDAWDWDWPLDGSRFTVWAMGPVSEGSNASEPVVLYHRLLLPGATEEDTIHAPLGQNYRLNLGQASPAAATCMPLLANARTAQVASPNSAAAPAAEPGQVATLEDVEEFEVVTGDNKDYPNPPGWGISYHINGEESPVLKVKRGKTYTFKVMAGESHPLYLTSSIIGGGAYNRFQGETVYAGGEDSHGTPEKPYLLTWTPDAATPDLLYYQCAVHMKLGWQILVGDA